MDKKEHFLKAVNVFSQSLALFCTCIFILGGFLLYLTFNPDSELFKKSFEVAEEQSVEVVKDKVPEEAEVTGIKDGIHVETGFLEGKGLQAVINNCTNCHSSKLVTQNHMTKEGWLTTIRWMQETQNLWDLGDQEDIILDYLATNYAPKNKGRRENLVVDEWYQLN